MPRIILLLSVLLFTSKPLAVFGQTADSLEQTTISADSLSHAQEDYYHEELEDDFSPGLGIFALFAFAFMFICVGVGIVLAIVALLLLFALIASGVLSASILVGLHNKSFEKGFGTFIISATTILGLLLGIPGFWLLNKMLHWFTTEVALIIGSIGGLLTGLLLGLILFYLIRKLTAFLKDNLKTL